MSQSRPWEFLKFRIPGIQEFLFHCTFNIDDDHDQTLAFRWVTAWVYVLSCRLTFGPLWLRIILLLFVVSFCSFCFIFVALDI